MVFRGRDSDSSTRDDRPRSPQFNRFRSRKPQHSRPMVDLPSDWNTSCDWSEVNTSLSFDWRALQNTSYRARPMYRSTLRRFRLATALTLGTTAFVFSAVPVRADEGEQTSDSGAAIADLGGGDIEIGDQVGTVTSSNLRGQGALEEALGRRAYFESLSAINLQKAIDEHLDNERERIESYYEARNYRDAQVEADRPELTQEIAMRRAKEAAPDRLTSQDLDEKTGKIFWPDPLDDKVLVPYTRLINEKFAKRADPGQVYRGSDARMVQRMVRLMQRAVDTIKHELPIREYIAISDYLASVGYEAYFDSAGNRVINEQ